MKKIALVIVFWLSVSSIPLAVSESVLAQSDDNPFTEEQERCISQSVVQLQVQTADGMARRASGVVVDSEGIIFTNAHVVEDATEIQVWTYEQAVLPPVFAYFATPQLLSEDLDFAVIEIVADAQGNPIDKENLDFPCTLPWNKTPLTRYAPIYIVGYPDIGGGVLTSTSGIVSAPLQQTGINGQNISLYTTDAIFSDGGSGGLVVNTRGEFLGIPSYWRTQSDGTGQLTYFIPLSTVCEIEPDVCGGNLVFDVTATSPAPPAAAINPPAARQIAPGNTFEIRQNESSWGWICVGDLELTSPSNLRLYDWGTNPITGEDATGRTGLIVVIPPDSRISLNMPWGGFCEPNYENQLESRLPFYINILLNSTSDQQCDGNGSLNCDSTEVIWLSKNGDVLQRRMFSDPYSP